MDNNALDRAIATFMEPEPALRTARKGDISSGRFWEWHSTVDYGTLLGEWKPRSHREPEVAMKLLKDLNKGGVLTIGKQEIDAFAQWFVGVHTRPFEFAGELEDAIALAFVKANGLEVE